MFRNAFHGKGCDELRVPVGVVPDAHVTQLRVGDALVGRPGILQRAQLQLALEVPVRVRSRALEIVHVVLRRLVEGHGSRQ